MNRRIIFEDENGRCNIVYPDDGFMSPWEKEEQAISRLFEISVPDVHEFIVCRDEQIPKDLTFRQAWKKGDVNEPIKIDLKKAIQIHRERLFIAAHRKIDKLYEEFDQAVLNKDNPLQVAIRRTIVILQKIHEMNLTHCKNPDDVKISVPKELKEVWSFYKLD